MKKFHLFYCLIAVVGALALYSCLKESADRHGEIENPITVAEAKAIFEAELGKYDSRQRPEDFISLIPIDFTPDWDKPVYDVSKNGVLMTIPLAVARRSVYAKRDSLPGDLGARAFTVRVIQSLAIVKNSESGESTVYIQSVVSDRDYYSRNKNKNFVDVNDKDFSGFALYHKLGGRMEYLVAYRKGRPCGQIYFGDCVSADDLSERLEQARKATGRVEYLLNISATRNDDVIYEYNHPGLTIPFIPCNCLIGGECKCSDCLCSESCSACGEKPVCTDCPTCHVRKCKCDCPPPIDTGGGGSGGGSGGGGGGGGNNNNNGYSPVASKIEYMQLDPSIVAEDLKKKLEEIRKTCLGEGLHNLLQEGRDVNVTYSENGSKYSAGEDEVGLAGNAGSADLFHELGHHGQSEPFKEYRGDSDHFVEDYENIQEYNGSQLNIECEMYFLTYRYVQQSGVSFITGIPNAKWMDSEEALACQIASDMLDSRGNLKPGVTEKMFNDAFENIGKVLQENHPDDYGPMPYNKNWSASDNLRMTRKISSGC